eukprot:TRINITY_DN619_c0_g1_i3.p1 TRINITY_DN619_c0_g1~~TRINITY_DN619_c0_g1_i3.p1  ORF type:complete len:314 (+),score=85.97 TRINITY_DN619_c0_g1_i3:83-1024(+)
MFFNTAFGPGALGAGKSMNDLYTKGFNGDAWRMESYLKRDKTNQVWVDPSANLSGAGNKLSATFGYDNMDANMKYRGTTDNSFGHTSELAWTLPLQDGDQRVKVEIRTKLDKQTFLPDVSTASKKFFYKATLPKITGEAEVDGENAKVWARGSVCDDLAYGTQVNYAMSKSAITSIEAGLIGQLSTAFGKIAAKGVYTRKNNDGSSSDSFEFGLLPPAQSIGDRKVKTFAKLNVAGGNKDLGLVAETSACPCVDVKAKVDLKGLAALTSAFSATWNAPGGWRISASIAEVCNKEGKNTKFGLRLSQGSTPPPL